MEDGGRVTVAVRFRPTSSFDDKHIVCHPDGKSLTVYPPPTFDAHPFRFSRVFTASSQSEIYSELLSPLLPSLLGGEGRAGAGPSSIAFLAFGQTGSGKTHSTLGDTNSFANRGVAPRAIADVFAHIAAKPELDVSVAASYCEVYNERIIDLLETSGFAAARRPPGVSSHIIANNGTSMAAGSSAPPDYAIYDDPVEGVVVRGLSVVPVASEESAFAALYSGESVRIRSAHRLNSNSNRSHCIFTLHVRHRAREGSGKERIAVAKLHFVDLAGTERLKKTGVTPDDDSDRTSVIARESMHINRSLAYLEQCVVALSRASANAMAAANGAVVKATHVPYRQSKLTSILKDSLSGNAALVFLACAWGEEGQLEETTSTLRLAARMTTVANTAPSRSGVMYDTTELIKKYERTIQQLQQELAMHDALTDRAAVTYGEYTPEQQHALARQLRAYVDAPPGDDSSDIKIESVAQMREILRQVKSMVRSAAVEAEEALRARYTFVAKEADAPSSAAHAAGTKAAPGSVGPVPSQEHTGAGELDARSGVALGLAPASAKPSSYALSPQAGSPSRYSSAMSPTQSMGGIRAASPTHSAGMRSPSRTAASKDDMNAAWREYRTSGPGAAAAIKLQALKSELVTRKAAVAAAAKQVNTYKVDIDTAVTQLQGVLPEDRKAAMMKKLQDSKAAYRGSHAVLQQERKLLDDIEYQVEAKTRELVSSFELWYQAADGVALSTTFLNAMDVKDGDDVLDEAEAFERLERDRIAAIDPDSLTFFTATKQLRNTRIAVKHR